MILNLKASMTLASLAALGLAAAHPAAASTTFTENAGMYSGTYFNAAGATGFGDFHVTTSGTGASGPFAGVFLGTASASEGNNGTPKPGSIDSANGTSFGSYANDGNGTTKTYPMTTITQSFSPSTEASGLATTGDSFSLDFVPGYNDTGDVGVELTNASGAVGSFFYNQGGVNGAVNPDYYFNGVDTKVGYSTGALHLTYTLTSATTYSFTSSGAVTYSGTGSFTSPITGYQVSQYDTQQANGSSDHNAYFNNLSLTTANTVSAAPEPSQLGMLALMGFGLGGLLLTARKRSGLGSTAV